MYIYIYIYTYIYKYSINVQYIHMMYRLQNAPFFEFAQRLPRACVFRHMTHQIVIVSLQTSSEAHSSFVIRSSFVVRAIHAIAVSTTGVDA
jgi:hypothetical protein